MVAGHDFFSQSRWRLNLEPDLELGTMADHYSELHAQLRLGCPVADVWRNTFALHFVAESQLIVSTTDAKARVDGGLA